MVGEDFESLDETENSLMSVIGAVPFCGRDVVGCSSLPFYSIFVSYVVDFGCGSSSMLLFTAHYWLFFFLRCTYLPIFGMHEGTCRWTRASWID